MSDALTWQATGVESVASMIARGARPEAFLRFGMDAQIVAWLTHAAAPDDTRILAVVTASGGERPGWFRCGLCGRRGARPNDLKARAAVLDHFAVNHAMIGRIPKFIEMLDSVGEALDQ